MKYNDILGNLIQENEVEKANYRFIETIRLESYIQSITNDIKTTLGVNYISCHLRLSNGVRYILSNNPGGIVIPYYELDLHRIDNVFNYDFEKSAKTDYFVPATIPCCHFGQLFEDILQEHYNVTNVIGFYRGYQGHKLITIFGVEKNNVRLSVTENRLKEFYQYTYNFLSEMLPLYITNKSSLKYSPFLQSNAFRKKLIFNELQEVKPILNERELQCLYWARMGKTVDETALILSLSKSTIKRYLENIREKYGVSSTPEAIVLAIQQKLIA